MAFSHQIPAAPITPAQDSDNQEMSPDITKCPWDMKIREGYCLELDKVIRFNEKKK